MSAVLSRAARAVAGLVRAGFVAVLKVPAADPGEQRGGGDQARRLLDLLMDGLRYSATGAPPS
ncbi:MAG TPA: hypothetical protein VMV07_16845 [Streptosporangiaceae bacterium]|nr:hypothetical protein [Streptosporangiaceae bacterium]